MAKPRDQLTSAKPRALLTSDSVIYRNLKDVAYKKTHVTLEERAVSMTTVGNYVIVGLAKHGCHVFSLHGDRITRVCVLGEQTPKTARSRADRKSGGATCHNICAGTRRIVYIKESEGQTSICVHTFEDVIKGTTKPEKCLMVRKRAPMVYDDDLGLLAVGGGAWASSWTVEGESNLEKGGSERNIRVLNVADLETVCEWEVVDNAVYLLRLQITQTQSMLGVADSRNGLRVFDLKRREAEGYACLYRVPVEEVRNFQLVGNYVGVFHKFEPNVSFWNMTEQKTILCINIQEQIKQLAEEYYEEEDDESGLFDENDDNVTSVSSIPFEDDHILIYGTRAGCIFGMAVDIRCKIFSIPFSHEGAEEKKVRKDVLSVSLLPDGKMVVCYEGCGLTMLDFSPENPPDRPPTRGQPK